MSYVEAGTRSFPSFQRSKDFFRSGIGEAPQYQLTDAPAVGGGSAGPESGLSAPSDTAVGAAPAPAPAPQPAQQTQPAAQTLQNPTPGTNSPYDLGYQQTGSLEERLYNPLQEAGQVGGERLEEFANMFSQQAGPSRSYEGIGAQQTLDRAITGDAPTAAGRELVTAQYGGPAGLDPAGSAYLQDLARQMQSRQQMLQTGGGTTTAIGQSVAGLTPGEARYQAKTMFAQPGYREDVAARTAGVGDFQSNLDTETQAAAQYAAQRAGEEQAIAQQSQQYLTGRGEGISGDIEQSVQAAEAENQARQGLYDQLLAAGTPQEQVAFLQQLQERGGLEAEGDTTDPSAFLSPIRAGGDAADALREEIMAKYPELAGIDPLGRGLSGSGRGTLTYTGEGRGGQEVDYRSLYDKGTRGELATRQKELEQAFDPLLMAQGRGAEGAAYNPLYGGKGFESPEITDYLGFDPGMKPARGNIATEDQRTQFNNIQDMLGNLDRITEAQSPFQAAIVGAQIDQYLTDEEEAFESQKGQLSDDALQWKKQVKKLRKDYKKAKTKQKWGQVLDIVGGVLGLPGVSHQTIDAEPTATGTGFQTAGNITGGLTGAGTGPVTGPTVVGSLTGSTGYAGGAGRAGALGDFSGGYQGAGAYV